MRVFFTKVGISEKVFFLGDSPGYPDDLIQKTGSMSLVISKYILKASEIPIYNIELFKMIRELYLNYYFGTRLFYKTDKKSKSAHYGNPQIIY